jgi:hypothetical protein
MVSVSDLATRTRRSGIDGGGWKLAAGGRPPYSCRATEGEARSELRGCWLGLEREHDADLAAVWFLSFARPTIIDYWQRHYKESKVRISWRPWELARIVGFDPTRLVSICLTDGFSIRAQRGGEAEGPSLSALWTRKTVSLR